MDPLDIIYNMSNNNVTAPEGMYIGEFIFILRMAGLIICTISIGFSLIKLLFINGAQQIQEQKTEISHKAWVVVLLASVFFLMNIVKSILDSFFM